MPDRFARQHQIIHPDMRQLNVTVAGCGMNGSWVTHGLVRAVNRVTVYDGQDTVEEVNLGNQAYSGDDIGAPKSEALIASLGDLPIWGFQERWPPKQALLAKPDIVVSCVDSMRSRGANARWCQRNRIPFIDTRAQGEYAVILFTPADRIDEYLADLPKDSEVENAPCGAAGGAYTGLWFGSQVPAWINNWCRGLRLPKMLVWHVGLNQEINRVEWSDTPIQ